MVSWDKIKREIMSEKTHDRIAFFLFGAEFVFVLLVMAWYVFHNLI